MNKKEITVGLMARTDKYHDEFARFVSRFYGKDDTNKEIRLAFIEANKEKFPMLANPKVCFRIGVRQFFDSYVYTLRGQQFKIELRDAPKGFLNER